MGRLMGPLLVVGLGVDGWWFGRLEWLDKDVGADIALGRFQLYEAADDDSDV